jgi:hypothetical protein
MQRRVLEVAADIVGGIPELCKRLECSEDELQAWLEDREVCPLPRYLKAVDIILESGQGFSAIFSKDPPSRDDPGR